MLRTYIACVVAALPILAIARPPCNGTVLKPTSKCGQPLFCAHSLPIAGPNQPRCYGNEVTQLEVSQGCEADFPGQRSSLCKAIDGETVVCTTFKPCQLQTLVMNDVTYFYCSGNGFIGPPAPNSTTTKYDEVVCQQSS
jgi:hypothetical protein